MKLLAETKKIGGIKFLDRYWMFIFLIFLIRIILIQGMVKLNFGYFSFSILFFDNFIGNNIFQEITDEINFHIIRMEIYEYITTICVRIFNL